MAETSAFRRSVGTIRRISNRTPLRTKLITAVLGLVAVALAVIGIAGVTVVRSYLLSQADNQLQSLHDQVGSRFPERFARAPSPDYWVFEAVISPSQVNPVEGSYLPDGIPGPQLTGNIAALLAHPGQPMTVPSESGGNRWRVVAYPSPSQGFTDPQTGGQFKAPLIVGLNVSNAYATVGRLVGIDLIVSAVVLLGLAIVGIAVVRTSLRPLTDIERTAEGIAAGDLTKRIPDRDPRTEVGRLGRSLNAMLAQIEAGFHARSQSETAARRSEDRMRQFVADASHELRTPLTAIRGFAEYYRQRGGIGPAELERIMRRVEQESARMGVLVEDMLLLARLDQQRPLEHGPVDLLTLAADARHDARVMAPDREINLTVGGSTALIVLGDEVRLRQVIGNLMSNALTHTPDRTPIDIRVRSGTMAEQSAPGPGLPAMSAPPGRYEPPGPPAVIFEVADQGPGLTPEQASHVFERFYRADQARTRKAGGTGLGLAIVAALIAAHGGTVRVDSAPGQGATFRIALPLAPEARPADPVSHITDSGR